MKYYEIRLQQCEVCGEESQTILNDKDMNLHYACLVHVEDLYNKLNNIVVDQ